MSSAQPERSEGPKPPVIDYAASSQSGAVPYIRAASVVVVFIGVTTFAVWLVMPRFGSNPGQVPAAEVDLGRLAGALEAFRADVGQYPSTQEGLSSLVERPVAGSATWKGPYIVEGELPRDPWGNAYRYSQSGSGQASYDLRSDGPDGVPSTPDDVLPPVRGRGYATSGRN